MIGPIEAAGFFAVVLVLAIIELVRTRAVLRRDREQEAQRAKDV